MYENILNKPHLLIAGATGSGKTTFIHSLIFQAMKDSTARFILIDPKRVALLRYKDYDNVLTRAVEFSEIVSALQFATDIMNERYYNMELNNIEECNDSKLYVIIDEYADLVTDRKNKSIIKPIIQRLAQLSRGANISLWLGSQCCLSTVIDSEIKCNFPYRIGLRVGTARESRNIIDEKGCELLPHYGKALFTGGVDGVEKISITPITDEQKIELDLTHNTSNVFMFPGNTKMFSVNDLKNIYLETADKRRFNSFDYWLTTMVKHRYIEVF